MAAKRGILREMAEEVAHNPMQLQEMRRVSREEDEQIAEEEEEAAKGGGQSPGR
jgi:hypothetical protein